MATYTQLSTGSRGDEVKKLQQALIDAGYDVGTAGVDGSYGSATTAAVKKYQQDNGLQVDGIAGEQTLGKLYTVSGQSAAKTTNAAPATSATTTATTTDYSKYQYDAASNDAYMQALAALQAAQKEVPTYAGTYDAQLQDLYNQIVNRDKFKYDLNSDMLYNQYKDQYMMQGQMAMKDTMGQAAALTGGYGSTYAQAVGQQAYDSYLQQLNDVVPELYGMALDQYNMEGDQMLQQYSMLGDMADTEYGRYQDSLNQYWQNVSFLKDQTDDAYTQGYENWYNSQQMGLQQEQWAYQQEQDNYSKQLQQYDRLAELITTTGYSPTSSELAAAGMSSAQAKAYKDYYTKQNTPSGSYTTSKKTPTTPTTPTVEDTKQEAIKNFSAKTYSEAVAYLKKNGVAGAAASNIMTESEWSRRKSAILRAESENSNSSGSVFDNKESEEYLTYGRGYDTYLKKIATYLIQNS